MAEISTKDRILNAALTLFAERGYDGVGVDLIAARAGLKGPSLYKHFRGKAEILDALIERTGLYYEMNFGSAERPGKIPESTEELIALSMGRIRFTMQDPLIRKVRRLLVMEQFRNPAIAALATAHSMDGIQHMYAGIFRAMQERGILRQDDPEAMAAEFAAPVTLLLQMCDRQPERQEEALGRIEIHLQHFARHYGSEINKGDLS